MKYVSWALYKQKVLLKITLTVRRQGTEKTRRDRTENPCYSLLGYHKKVPSRANGSTAVAGAQRTLYLCRLGWNAKLCISLDSAWTLDHGS